VVDPKENRPAKMESTVDRDRAGQAGEGRLLARKVEQKQVLEMSLRTCMQIRREFHLFADWRDRRQRMNRLRKVKGLTPSIGCLVAKQVSS
jgi:hypothetical protein